MDSLHSGYHNRDLLVVETKDILFVIKGKETSEQYESLKKNKEDLNQERTSIKIKSKDIYSKEIYCKQSNALTTNGVVEPIFFENGIYQVVIESKNNKEIEFDHEFPSFKEAIEPLNRSQSNILIGNLHFMNEVGYSELIVKSQENVLLSIIIEIYPTKLDYKNDYKSMLSEVNDEVYNLAYQYLKRTFVSAKIKLDGRASEVEFYRLIEHYITSIHKGIKQIENQPHHQLTKEYHRVRADKIKRQDNRVRKYLRSNSHLFTEHEKGISVQNKRYLPMAGLTVKKIIDYNTLENQFIKWIITRLVQRFSTFIERLETLYEDPSYLVKAKQMKSSFLKVLKRPFWTQIDLPKRSVMSLVLQMAPGYREVFKDYLIVMKGLSIQSDIHRMSLKDIAELYEYWTFIKLSKIMAKHYTLVSDDLIKYDHNHLYVRLAQNTKTKREFINDVTGEKVVITYQHKYMNLPTTMQEPDTVFEIIKENVEGKSHYIFDAKYKVKYNLDGSVGPTEEDINTMHRYRDAIVYKALSEDKTTYKKVVVGAYVLFPWYDEESYKSHQFYKSIEEVNIGGLPFLPETSGIVEDLIKELIN